MTDKSIISNDIIVLPNKEIILPETIIFIDDMKTIINGKWYRDSTERDNVTQYEVIPFAKNFLAESDMIFLAGESNPNNMNLMTIGLYDSTLKYISGENTLCVEERKSPRAKTPIFVQGLCVFGSHVPFPTAHVTNCLLNENPENSDKDSFFLKYYTAKIKSKSPRTMTHSLTCT